MVDILNNADGTSDGYKLSDATFTVNARPVNIYALPYDGEFNNSAPEALRYCLTEVEGLTRATLLTGFTCESGWVSREITVHANTGTTTVSVTDSNSLLNAADAMYRVYGNNKKVTTQEEIVAAGTTTVKFSDTELAKLKNYQIAVNETTYEITPKFITVTADDIEKIYGEADPAFTFTVNGCVEEIHLV